MVQVKYSRGSHLGGARGDPAYTESCRQCLPRSEHGERTERRTTGTQRCEFSCQEIQIVRTWDIKGHWLEANLEAEMGPVHV